MIIPMFSRYTINKQGRIYDHRRMEQVFFSNLGFPLSSWPFWAAAQKGPRSCRTEGDFCSSFRQSVLLPPQALTGLKSALWPLRSETADSRPEKSWEADGWKDWHKDGQTNKICVMSTMTLIKDSWKLWTELKSRCTYIALNVFLAIKKISNNVRKKN